MLIYDVKLNHFIFVSNSKQQNIIENDGQY
jgi:hypothetical protein